MFDILSGNDEQVAVHDIVRWDLSLNKVNTKKDYYLVYSKIILPVLENPCLLIFFIHFFLIVC